MSNNIVKEEGERRLISEVALFGEQLLDLVVQTLIVQHFVDVQAAWLRAWLPGCHCQSIINVLISTVVRIVVGPLGKIV